jgi:hypothetical protein
MSPRSLSVVAVAFLAFASFSPGSSAMSYVNPASVAGPAPGSPRSIHAQMGVPFATPTPFVVYAAACFPLGHACKTASQCCSGICTSASKGSMRTYCRSI